LVIHAMPARLRSPLRPPGDRRHLRDEQFKVVNPLEFKRTTGLQFDAVGKAEPW